MSLVEVMEECEVCEACGISNQGVEEHGLVEYREHRICTYCVRSWAAREKRTGYKLSWEEFTTGKLKR